MTTSSPGADIARRLEPLVAQFTDEVEAGALPSIQMAAAVHGELALDETIGADKDSRYQAFSLAKPAIAGLVAQLVDEGTLDLQLRVAEVVDGFGDNGKQAVTVDHLLLHTAGFPGAPMKLLEGADRPQRIARMRTWRTDWEPGTATSYHATSAHWALATVIEAVTGSPLRTVVDTFLSAHLGLTEITLGGLDPRIREVQVVGEPTPDDVVAGLAAQGIDLDAVVGEAAASHALAFNDPAVRASGVPGGGLATSARAMVAYLSRWLRPDGAWSDEVVTDFRDTVRNNLVDRTMGIPANRTRAFVLAGRGRHATMRGFGSSVSPATFGHGGAGGQIAWADPETGVAFCLLTDGFERDPLQSMRRVFEASTAVAGAAARIGTTVSARQSGG